MTGRCASCWKRRWDCWRSMPRPELSEGTAMNGRNGVVNAMSVDVEDYYQVSAFAGTVDRAKWNSLPSRVEDSTRRTLDMFAEAGVRATFFTLGCVAERHKGLVRAIADAGHEVASHGWEHYRVGDQTPAEFRADVI